MDADAQISQQILNKYKTLLSQNKKQNQLDFSQSSASQQFKPVDSLSGTIPMAIQEPVSAPDTIVHESVAPSTAGAVDIDQLKLQINEMYQQQI